MTNYLLLEGQKIALEDPYFNPIEGMTIFIAEKPYTIHIKTIVRAQGENGDVESELQCSAL